MNKFVPLNSVTKFINCHPFIVLIENLIGAAQKRRAPVSRFESSRKDIEVVPNKEIILIR